MPTYLILAQYAVCDDPVGPGQSLSISNTCCEDFQINLDFCEEDFSSLGFRYVLIHTTYNVKKMRKIESQSKGKAIFDSPPAQIMAILAVLVS